MWIIFLCLLNGVNSVIAQHLLQLEDSEPKWVVTVSVVVAFVLGYAAKTGNLGKG